MQLPSGRPRRRGIYILPNLFTTLGLFAGFYSIVAAARGDFGPACAAVFVSIVTDGLDGRVARLTGTETDFGAEYDSLSDMVAFGVAPALLVYDWALQDLGKVGWLLAFFTPLRRHCAWPASTRSRRPTERSTSRVCPVRPPRR